MATIERSIDVAVPVRTAYNQWTQFEEFPRFMDGVERVEQIDDTHLHWVANVAGKRKEWNARITEQPPDESVAWTSESGARNDVVETVGDKLGFMTNRVRGDLERFKQFMSRGRETGAWRGEVRH
jgi:uncharacterized membrane protein